MSVKIPWVRIDLHVHTRRFSPCAESLDPERLPQCMERRGLDALVITEHDQLWPAEDIVRLNRRLRRGHIFRGVEVSSRNGHFVVIGLKNLDGILPGIGLESLAGRAHSQNAAIIWAHPFQHYSHMTDPCNAANLPTGIHAVEVASGITGAEQTLAARKIADRMRWAAVAGSDAHAPQQVGCAFTLFPELPEDEQALAAAIRKGCCRTVHLGTPAQAPGFP